MPAISSSRWIRARPKSADTGAAAARTAWGGASRATDSQPNPATRPTAGVVGSTRSKDVTSPEKTGAAGSVTSKISPPAISRVPHIARGRLVANRVATSGAGGSDTSITLNAKGLFAGHNPKNVASRKILLEKLGFAYVGDVFYPPTGMNHPSYSYRPDPK